MHLGVYDKENNFAGWSFGWQENATTYYMCNSAVFKKYRRKGIYNALLKTTLSILCEKGFQLIYSRHNATNNNVIIPFTFLFLAEIFPLKSTGSFFTTGNSTYIFLIIGILIGIIRRENSIENKN